MDGDRTVRRYYRAVDAAEYDALEDLLAAEFVHVRPDRTLEGRAAFVEFMRSGRPDTDTTHDVERVYDASTAGRYAAEGRLLAADGTPYFGFVDTFDVGADGIRRLRTYTDRHPTGST